MSFHDILGQEDAKRLLQNALRKDAVSHAYLFTGPSGSGQMKTALMFAQAIFCTACEDDACGECLECRKVEHGNHPDLSLLKPDGASIKIDQIRELQRMFSYRSEGVNPKVYIIEGADRMTVQAANSLLKFLEEPPAPAVGILISDNSSSLLPTIQSRTQRIPFSPLHPDIMLQALSSEGVPVPLARCAVSLTSGLDGCRELLAQNWFAEMRNLVLQLAKESLGKGSSAVATAGQKLFKTGLGEHLDILFSMFHLWFKDMLYFLYRKHESIVFIDQLDFISRHARQRSTEQWVAYMEFAAESKGKLRSNANAQLCLEQFLIRLES
ncbi:DNA polymerase III subunit tau [compost metagenome]|uniref:ATPase n=1 Tax=Paenibacillus jilunlii TaxID=682956 RepID=A0A1G9ZAN5_9BACL|nr:DNA polymerase III subunit delta' [Paenibacillus jilunlii]KWX79137.1 ATPase [Paenibacillus jilunlii]SDN18384.1 DNA polymerase III, delta prime subunit [Paenibacillus jilunlii]